ncbi:MAG: DUF1844 domain-containing protein [bacterium]
MTKKIMKKDINKKEAFQPDIKNLISSLYTAILYNLGEVSVEGVSNIQVNLRTARFNLDMLRVLEKKTAGNLSEEERDFLKKTMGSAEIKIKRHGNETES